MIILIFSYILTGNFLFRPSTLFIHFIERVPHNDIFILNQPPNVPVRQLGYLLPSSNDCVLLFLSLLLCFVNTLLSLHHSPDLDIILFYSFSGLKSIIHNISK